MPKKRSQKQKPLYLDSAQPVSARVRDLLGRMTLEEKLRQMTQRDIQRLTADNRVTDRVLREHIGELGIGTLQDLRSAPGANAEAVNAVQKYLTTRTRLGIPGLVISECLHGHLSGGATVFPQAIAMASTWNTELIRSVGETIAREARAVGVAQALAPDLDLARDPRWGRVEETYGEDPWLVARMGVAYITGMQGSPDRIDGQHVACMAKHYAAHGSPEAGINLAPVAGGLRELRTLYLPPFEAAVCEAGVLSVMPAYSEYDGVPASASRLLLQRVLREEWGFRGYTYSDYGAIQMLVTMHRTADSPAEAGRQALEAGMDLEAPGEYGYGERLLELVRAGRVAESRIDEAVSRILRVKFMTGLFENPFVDTNKVSRLVHAPAHRRLAREVARESIILLKNEKNLLPLSADIGSIAVIGPNADRAQLGGYSQHRDDAVTPLQGIRAAAARGTRIVHARGCEVFGTARDGIDEARRAASDCDVAVVVLGGCSRTMGGVGWETKRVEQATCGEGHDRTELTPPGVQGELLRAVYDTGTPTVLVLMHGRPYSIEWEAQHVPAIVETWYAGEQGGHALADVLFGKVNPSGKLPISVPRSVGHVPAFYNHKPSARGYYHKPGTPDAPGRDYVFSSPDPLFEFGFGLSYTSFKYTSLRVSPRRIPPAGRVAVSVDVANTGKRAGKEVVQLYLNDVVSSVTTPVKALRRFAKLELQPGEKRTVRFELGPRDLSILDEDMLARVEPGKFEVMAGGLTRRFEVV